MDKLNEAMATMMANVNAVYHKQMNLVNQIGTLYVQSTAGGSAPAWDAPASKAK